VDVENTEENAEESAEGGPMTPRRLCLQALLVALAAPSWAAGPAVASADVRAVRAVIEGQLAALARDDAAAAFGYAAPRIRAQFGSAERFVEMVRGGYPAVVRPASVAFMLPEWFDGELIQGVQLADAQGGQWLAIYRMERQPDGAWRIAGCELRPSRGLTL
jgi:hypothetical protein